MTGVQTISPYPNVPPKTFRVVGHNLGGYSDPLDSQGLSGTVIPHAGPAGSFGSTKPAADPLSVGIMTIQEATPENPYGGVKMLTPLIQNVTAQDRVEAMRLAATMTTDPIQQGIKMFEILASKGQANKEAAQAPPPPPPQLPPPVPMAPPGFLPVTQAAAPVVAAPAQVPADQWQSLMMQMAAMMHAQQQPVRPIDPPPAHPAAPPMPPPPPPPVVATASSPPPFSLAELLQIPGLDFQPQKPSAKVIFNLGQFGNMTAYYHWVLSEDNALFLVTDNRWEGSSYAPERLGRKAPIKVTLQNTQEGPKVFTCYSVGLTLNLGIFSIITLIKGDTTNG